MGEELKPSRWWVPRGCRSGSSSRTHGRRTNEARRDWTNMTGVDDVTSAVHLRDVEDRDLDVFFVFQADPQAAEMAAVLPRDEDGFAAHWAKLRFDGTMVVRTIVADGVVAGNIGSWQENGQQLLGYWVGRE